MTLALVFWLLMGMITLVLIVMTQSWLTHDPEVCRTCVDRAARARRRHPSFTGPEDRPHWGKP